MDSENYFGNVSSPGIQALVQQLEATCVGNNPGNDNAMDFIRAAFAWVRDHVAYEWQLDWAVTVDETLASGRGNCFVKSCLLVTLLRARGICAKYVVARIALACPLVWRMAPDWAWSLLPSAASPHAAVTVQVGDKNSNNWIILDPTVDKALALGMRAMGNHAVVTKSWNGGHHVVNECFLACRPQPHDNIDFLLRKKPYYRPATVALLNASASFLRRHGNDSLPMSSPETMQRALDEYLLSHVSPTVVASAIPLPPCFKGRAALMEAAVQSDPTALSVFCNHHHPAIRKLAQQLRRRLGGNNDDRAFAQAAFRLVRDHVDYTLQADWSVPVEYTLATRRGMCSTKACLLTALLRAGGLQAGFFLKPQNAMQNFVIPSWIAQHYNTRSIHILSAVQFQNDDDATQKWIKLDPYIDGNLARSMEAAQLVYEPGYRLFVDFDGYNNALGYKDDGNMELRTDHIDDLMIKQSRVPPAVLQCHNICLELLRQFGPLFSSEAQVLHAMEQHLFKFHPQLVAQVISSASARTIENSPKVLRLPDNSTSIPWPSMMQPLSPFQAKL